MKLWDADTPDEKVETDAGVESCENPKSRFEINRDIPSETERNQSILSASGTALTWIQRLFTPISDNRVKRLPVSLFKQQTSSGGKKFHVALGRDWNEAAVTVTV